MDSVGNVFLAGAGLLIAIIAVALLLRSEMRDFANFLILLFFGVLIPGSLCAVGIVYWQAEEFFTGGLYIAFSLVWWIIVLNAYKS